jgi:cytoskeletal protein RodZ
MPTIGQKLEETRRSRGLALEDVARATRIHPAVLARIEEDDFSQFPSVAYARSFLRQYGRHLGLDLEEALAALGARDARFSEDLLMEEMKGSLRKGRRFRLARIARILRPRAGRRRGRPLFLDAILVTLLGAIGLFYFLGYNAPTPEQATEEIARVLGLPVPEFLSSDPSAEPPLPQLAPLPAEDGENAPTVVDKDEPRSIAASPAPLGNGPPVYPVLKQAVELKLDEEPSPAVPETEDGLRPRALPALDLAADAPGTPAVPALPESRRPEPQAVLRPEGTDPATAAPRSPEPKTPPTARNGAAPSPAPPGASATPPPRPGLRAQPVARRQ